MEIRRVLEDYAAVGKSAAAAPAATTKQKAAATPTPDENTAWKDLFDAANESILTDIKKE
jgi:hypothetical protein